MSISKMMYLAKNYSANDITYDDIINGRSKALKNCVIVYPNAKFFKAFDLQGRSANLSFLPSPKIMIIIQKSSVKGFKKIM